MNKTAIIYCEGLLGKVDGKTTDGLIRRSRKYKIVGVIDSTKVGEDTGNLINGQKNGISVFTSLSHALADLKFIPNYFIYGIAPAQAYLQNYERAIIISAMQMGLNIINPLQQFLNDDAEFIECKKKFDVSISDVRKPAKAEDMHLFAGRTMHIKTPVVVTLGTDSAIGKRTTSILLEEALIKAGIHAVFIATGQTSLIQGARYGVAVDAIPSQYVIGEIENEIMKAYDAEHPDIMIVEGQGAVSHPAYISSCGILRGARPGMVIIQHAPKRKCLSDFNFMKMPTIEHEIKIIENFSDAKVVAITINHEDMTDSEVLIAIKYYEKTLKIPVTDVLKYGCDKLIASLRLNKHNKGLANNLDIFNQKKCAYNCN